MCSVCKDCRGALQIPGPRQLIGAADPAPFDDEVDANPLGAFDIGAALGDSWLGSGPGGGNPDQGIAVSTFATFTFNLTGSGLGGVSTIDFLNALSDPTGGNDPEEFVVRFRGFNDGGSDKVPVDTSAPVPEPGTLALVGIGLASLSARRLASRKQ